MTCTGISGPFVLKQILEISCAHCSKSIGNYKVLRTIAPQKHARLECSRNRLMIAVQVITVIDMQQFKHLSVYRRIRIQHMTRVDISYSLCSISCFVYLTLEPMAVVRP